MYRKKIFTLSLITLTILCIQGQNLIKNGNFVKGNSRNIINWKKFPASAAKTIQLSNETADSSEKVLSINNVSEDDHSGVEQLVKVKPNTKYYLSFYAKGDYLTIPTGIGGALFIEGITRIGPGKQKGEFEWTKFSKIISSGKRKTLLIYLYLHKSRGIVYFKNIELRKATPELENNISRVKLENNKNNIVSGKNYEWNISPVANKKTSSMLTDNYVSVHSMPMSQQKEAVVWKKINRNQYPLTITFDLGKSKVINTIMLSTSGGGIYGMRWARSIRAYISNDGKSYRYAGDLITASRASLLAPEARRENNVKLYLKNIDTKAKFVKLAIVPSKQFFICDEIQIYGDKNFSPLKKYSELPVKTIKITNNELVEISSKMRFTWDIQLIADAIKNAKISNRKKQQLQAELTVLNKQISRWKFIGNLEKFRAILPFNELHSAIWSVYGKLLSAGKFAPLTAWSSYRYQHLGMPVIPKLKQKSLNLKMMRNEYRGLTFNLTNASDKKEIVKFQLEKLKGLNVKVFQVELVDTYYFIPRRQALVELFPQDGLFTTTVAAGMTRQIWLSYNSKNISPGTYHTKIKITNNNYLTALPLTLTVSNIKMPQEPTLTLGVYDTSDRRFKKKLQKKVLRDLKEHLVTCKMTQALAPMLAIPDKSYFNKNGILIKPLDFSTFDKYINDNPGFRKYFFSQSSDCGRTFPFSADSKEFSNAITQWASAWEKHLIEKGIPKGKIIFQFKDEPNIKAAKENIKWQKAVKAGFERISLYNAFDKPLPNDLMKEIVEMNNISTPTMTLGLWAGGNRKSERNKQLYEIINNIPKSDSELWFYMCIDPINIDPVAYYRLQEWQCFKQGAKGSAFWAYFDARGNSWNKYISNERDYAIIYRDADSVNGSKNWEAVREGVEDYEYLQMLTNRIKELKEQKKDVSHSQKVLDDAIKIALDKTSYNWYWYHWSRNTFGSQADRARLLVLKELERIQSL